MHFQSLYWSHNVTAEKEQLELLWLLCIYLFLVVWIHGICKFVQPSTVTVCWSSTVILLLSAFYSFSRPPLLCNVISVIIFSDHCGVPSTSRFCTALSMCAWASSHVIEARPPAQICASTCVAFNKSYALKQGRYKKWSNLLPPVHPVIDLVCCNYSAKRNESSPLVYYRLFYANHITKTQSNK